jgi:spermidine synthase
VDDLPVTLARDDGVAGEVALRQRIGGDGQPVFELIVNGRFLMDTAESSTESMLSQVVLDRHPNPRQVLMGGLGLGVSLRALLADRRVEHVVVVEIEQLVVGWLRSGLIPAARPAVADPRVEIVVADVTHVLQEAAGGRYDAVLLDVDNGPGFLVRPENAALYEPPALAHAARVVRPGGLLAVWSADPSPGLAAVLEAVVGPTERIERTVWRDRRRVSYSLYVAARITSDPRRAAVAQGG